MTTCENCGHPCVRGEDFCGTCGAYLSWEEEPAAEEKPTASAPPSSSAAPTPTVSPAVTPPVIPPRPTDPPQAAPPQTAPRRADPPQAVQPKPVRPGEEAPPPPPRPAEPEEREPIAPGDLICGRCGTGNVPSRRYCRRCGGLLEDARVAPKPPWWRRPFVRRPKTGPVVGDRPRVRPPRRPRFVVPLVLLVLLGVGGYAFRDELASGVEVVRDRFATPQQIHPTAVRASSEDPAHPAALAVDGTTDRYWAPARPGNGIGEFLEMDFPGPFRLLDLVVHPGISPNAEQFLTQARPQRLTVTLTGSDGKVTTRTVNPADAPGEQRFHLAVGGVVRIRLTIDGAYGAAPDRRVAVAEVEFFERP
ncbi:discoidin domain-containing protein [Streptomyces rubellomurinus]|uniref:discoidin domain-containing protein n=1 Tax=Streptomyces rubellomurinus (strain ATCC 31215) TaxID=359131 RepID=UPI000AAD475B|nr:discoidin domain-containing protein [Streptomyces rubellomurinus]